MLQWRFNLKLMSCSKPILLFIRRSINFRLKILGRRSSASDSKRNIGNQRYVLLDWRHHNLCQPPTWFRQVICRLGTCVCSSVYQSRLVKSQCEWSYGCCSCYHSLSSSFVEKTQAAAFVAMAANNRMRKKRCGEKRKKVKEEPTK